MSELVPIDFGAVEAKPTAEPATTNQSQRPTTNPNRRHWTTIALAAVIVFLLVIQFGGRFVPVPVPTPDIDIQGRYVLLLVDES